MKKTLTKFVLSVSAGALMGLHPALLANDPQVRTTADDWPSGQPSGRAGVQFETQDRHPEQRLGREDRFHTQERFRTEERFPRDPAFERERPVLGRQDRFHTQDPFHPRERMTGDSTFHRERPSLYPERQRLRDFPTAQPEPARLQPLSKVLGMDVRDRNDRNVGSVNDFLIELPSGRVPLAVVGAGGILGIGQRNIVIPPGELLLYPMDNALSTKLTRDEFRDAPTLRQDRFPAPLDQAWTRDVYRYYGEAPGAFRETRFEDTRFEDTRPARTIERESWQDRGFRDPAGAEPPRAGATFQGEAMTSDEEADLILRKYQRGKASAEALEEQLKRARAEAAYRAHLGQPRTTYDYIRDPAGAELRTELHTRQYSQTYPDTRRDVEFRDREVERDVPFRDRGPQVTDRMTYRDRETIRDRETERDAPFREREQWEPRDRDTRMDRGAGMVMRARDLLGMTIMDERQQTIGRIEDLVIDLHSGHLALAIVEPARELGVRNQVLALPPALLTMAPDERTLTARVRQDQLRQGPLIRRDQWQQQVDLDWTQDVYHYYRTEPFWDARAGMQRGFRDPAGTRFEPRGERREVFPRDQEMRGTDRFPQDQWRQDQWRQERGAELRRDEPWQREDSWTRETQRDQQFRYEQPRGEREDWQRQQWLREQRLRDQERLQRAEPFREDYRREIRDPSGAQMEQQRESGPALRFPAGTDQMRDAQWERERQQRELHQQRHEQQHLDRGPEIRDPSGAELRREQPPGGRQIDRQFMTSLREDPSLVEAARHVQVYREHGTIVLRGTVSTEQEKEQIEAKAREAAGQQRVANELRVADRDTTLQDQGRPYEPQR